MLRLRLVLRVEIGLVLRWARVSVSARLKLGKAKGLGLVLRLGIGLVLKLGLGLVDWG